MELTSTYRDKMNKLYIVTILLLMGCASKPDPEAFEIQNKKLTSQIEDGITVFDYTVAVKPSNTINISPKKRMSRSQYKKMLQTETFTDSSALKMQLEEQAVKLLEQAIKTDKTCAKDYEINHVEWRDYSVKLLGRCL